MLKTDAVHIWREADGDYQIEWQASHPDTEVAVEPMAEDGEVPAHGAQHLSGSARITGLPPARRHFFRVSDQHGNSVLVSERRLGMDGAPNFRDFGGYTGADGRRVKWGYLFRSGQLTALSDRDLALFASLKLDWSVTSVALRSNRAIPVGCLRVACHGWPACRLFPVAIAPL